MSTSKNETKNETRKSVVLLLSKELLQLMLHKKQYTHLTKEGNHDVEMTNEYIVEAGDVWIWRKFINTNNYFFQEEL